MQARRLARTPDVWTASQWLERNWAFEPCLHTAIHRHASIPGGTTITEPTRRLNQSIDPATKVPPLLPRPRKYH